MAPVQEGGNSWLDDLKELILKKKEENAALRKIQESLQFQGARYEGGGNDAADEASSSGQAKEMNLNTEDPNTHNP